MWADEAKQAIKNLEGNQPLMPEDIDVIREFIVSDAIHYLEVREQLPGLAARVGTRLMNWMANAAPKLGRDNIGEFRGRAQQTRSG